MDMVTRVQILDEIVSYLCDENTGNVLCFFFLFSCFEILFTGKEDIKNISYSTNTLGKGMNPIILPPAIGK